jgi:hypothetical protein
LFWRFCATYGMHLYIHTRKMPIKRCILRFELEFCQYSTYTVL